MRWAEPVRHESDDDSAELASRLRAGRCDRGEAVGLRYNLWW